MQEVGHPSMHEPVVVHGTTALGEWVTDLQTYQIPIVNDEVVQDPHSEHSADAPLSVLAGPPRPVLMTIPPFMPLVGSKQQMEVRGDMRRPRQDLLENLNKPRHQLKVCIISCDVSLNRYVYRL